MAEKPGISLEEFLISKTIGEGVRLGNSDRISKGKPALTEDQIDAFVDGTISGLSDVRASGGITELNPQIAAKLRGIILSAADNTDNKNPQS